MSVSDDMLGGGEPVRIRPAQKLDAQMNPVTRSGPGNVIHGCIVEPVSSDETTDDYGRGGRVTRLRVTAPGPIPFDVHSDDVAEVRGLEYEIDGDPFTWIDADPMLAGPVFEIVRGVG